MAVDLEKILASNEKWVIDGNYRKVALESRIRLSDLIIILNYGFLTCIWRVLKRNIIYWNKTRPDMQDGCIEKIDLEFAIASPFNLVLELADNPNWLQWLEDVRTWFKF